jgi:hypothetical protein
MTDSCFTYGSLMCEDIMSFVSGQAVRCEPAVLENHVRHPVRDEDYPGMIAQPGERVTGMVYRGLSTAALDRLDRFEGEMYVRCRVGVTDAAGIALDAWAYVFRPEFVGLLLPGDWDFEAFLAGGKARFEARYMGFDALT